MPAMARIAETVSLVVLIALAVASSAATGGLHGTALFGAIGSGVYALVVGVGVILVASRRSFVEWAARTGHSARISWNTGWMSCTTPMPAAPMMRPAPSVPPSSTFVENETPSTSVHTNPTRQY